MFTVVRRRSCVHSVDRTASTSPLTRALLRLKQRRSGSAVSSTAPQAIVLYPRERALDGTHKQRAVNVSGGAVV